jgi:glutamine synthetase
MKHKVEYVWLDGYKPEPNLRSKTKIVETQSIDKFSWGVSDRGSSIRVPQATAKQWIGYLEDRRPASNADPYRIVRVIEESLNEI